MGKDSAIRRRAAIAARLRAVINAGRPYTINNRRYGAFFFDWRAVGVGGHNRLICLMV
jgi:hypothetical protein